MLWWEVAVAVMEWENEKVMQVSFFFLTTFSYIAMGSQ